MDYAGIAQLLTVIFSGIATILGAIAAVYAARAKWIAEATAVHLVEAKEDIHKIEKATNSMKDALVLATHDAAILTGEAKGRADQKAESKADDKERKEGAL